MWCRRRKFELRMTKEEISLLQEAINSDGVDYALNYYSDWKEIKDKKFQYLLKEYITIGNELKEYLEEQGLIPD